MIQTGVAVLFLFGLGWIVGGVMGFQTGEKQPREVHLWECRVCGQIGATTRDLISEEIEHLLDTGCQGDLLEARRLRAKS